MSCLETRHECDMRFMNWHIASYSKRAFEFFLRNQRVASRNISQKYGGILTMACLVATSRFVDYFFIKDNFHINFNEFIVIAEVSHLNPRRRDSAVRN